MLGHSSAGGFDSSAGNVGIAGDGIELATAGFDADGDDTEPETAGANSVVETQGPQSRALKQPRTLMQPPRLERLAGEWTSRAAPLFV